MISLDFDTKEGQNKLDFHRWEDSLVIVAHNGFSYTRIVVPITDVTTLIGKLDDILDEPLKQMRDEAKSV